MQAYFRYVLGIRKPPRAVMIRGTAAHRANEATLDSKMRTGALLEDEEVAQVASDALDAEWLGQEPQLDEDEKALGADKVKAATKSDAISAACAYNRYLAPAINPVRLEHFVELECGGFPFDIVGRLDVEEDRPQPASTDGAPRTLRIIRDGKTSGKAIKAESAERSVQLHFYTFCKETTGTPIDRVAFDVMQVGKRATNVYPLEVDAPHDHGALVERIERAADVFEKGAFYPVDPTGPSGWVCSEKWCGYFHDCPFGARARTTNQRKRRKR